MPVAKATAITQVTDPSCEPCPVIGLLTMFVWVWVWERLARLGYPEIEAFNGWFVVIGRSPGRLRFCAEHWFNRLPRRQTVGARARARARTYTHWEAAGGWRCKGKFGPVGVTSVGAIVCVCNIMLSRRGVAGSNRSSPRSGPCWVISHSLGNFEYTHAHTHTHTRAHTRTAKPMHTACIQKKRHTNAATLTGATQITTARAYFRFHAFSQGHVMRRGLRGRLRPYYTQGRTPDAVEFFFSFNHSLEIIGVIITIWILNYLSNRKTQLSGRNECVC